VQHRDASLAGRFVFGVTTTGIYCRPGCPSPRPRRDNVRFFDHRREDARTDWDRGGLPNEEWEALLGTVRKKADDAGFYRYPLPKAYGGRDGTNLGMAIIREHLAAKGLGLHCDLQNEHSIVSNHVGVLLMLAYGTDEAVEGRDSFLEKRDPDWSPYPWQY